MGVDSRSHLGDVSKLPGMKSLTIALLLTGCATSGTGPAGFHQAAALPTAAPAPVPQFPRPGYTPAGAGASPLGQPWQPPEAQVARSPNRRILPPTPEPGLWAADDVEAVRQRSFNEMPAMISGVRLPSPKGESTVFTRRCAASMNAALAGIRLHETMARLHPDIRACVAARLFEYCTVRRAYDFYKKLMKAGTDSSRAMEQREAAVGVAVLFAESACNEQTYPREAADLYNKAADEWSKQNRMTKEDP